MRSVLCLGVGLALVALGCRPKIGDDCNVPTDCSQTGDRLCDTTQPDGYCTIFNCEAGSCPDEAVCIGFSSVLSSVAGDEEGSGWVCADPQGGSRFQRNFCMRSCESSSDCRSGYRCLDLGSPGNPYGAVLVETSRKKDGKVCTVPMSGGDRVATADAIPGICEGNPADAPGGASSLEVPASGGAAGSGTAGGGVTAGGAAGSGAAGGGVTAGGAAGSGGTAGSGVAGGGASGIAGSMGG
ncbi:MAG TPA: hypothetical protein PLU22_19475 [Polyangiaceae bacterium]|nr:hypothetical protein [Polyangiaceae bacterium]